MGRPLNKKIFGSNNTPGNQLTVRVKWADGSTNGAAYILKQVSTTSFLVAVYGREEICTLYPSMPADISVPGATGVPQPPPGCISMYGVIYGDNSHNVYVVKLSSNTALVKHTDGSYSQHQWVIGTPTAPDQLGIAAF